MKVKSKLKLTENHTDFDLDKKYFKYYWLIIPIFTLIYFLYSFISEGFYTDDEIGHFINMKDFWKEPGIIISNWGKPGWKIFMTLPSLLGYNIVVLFNSLIASLTIYFTILLAKRLNLKNSYTIVFFLGLQPIFWELSFRSYAEVFTGLVIVLMCYFFVIEKYNLSMLISGYLFLLRQETALIILALVIYLIIKKKYTPIFFALIFPAVLQLIGTWKNNGDWMWMIKDITSLQAMDFNKGTDRGFFFYFTNFIFIIGPVTLTFFIPGYFSFLKKGINLREHCRKYDVIYVVFSIFFLTQCYLVFQGTNAGLLRYMLPAVPLAALFANLGFNNIINPQYKTLNVWLLSILTIATLLFLSRDTNNWFMTEQREYSKFTIILIITLFLVYAVYFSKSITSKSFAILIFLLSIFYIYQKVEPLKLSEELYTIRSLTDWFTISEYKDKAIVYSHTGIPFYLYINKIDKSDKVVMSLNDLKNAPMGSICIWDSHYSYNPRYEYRNTNQTFFQNNPNFKLIKEFTSRDNRFQALVFEKVKDY